MADSNTRMNIDIDSEDYLPPGALPYNAEPIASTSTSTHRSQADINALLDQPLSDSTSRMRGWGPGEGRRDREKNLEARGEMRDGAEELLGRISDRKVYTLEADGVGLSMGNNSQEGEDEEVDENEENPKESIDFSFLYNVNTDSPIRDNALHLSGTPLAHLSTSKVFSYASLFGPVPAAVEWISDTRLVLLYNNPSSALDAINLLAKTGFHPFSGEGTTGPPSPTDLLNESSYELLPEEAAQGDQGDDPLELRACHNVPFNLLPTIEADGTPTQIDLLAGPEIIDGLISSRPSKSKSKSKRGNDNDSDDVPEGLRPGARLDIRWAVEDDVKSKTKAKDSEWYRRYGRDAGKVVDKAEVLEDVYSFTGERERGGDERRRRRDRDERRDNGRERRGENGRGRSRSPGDIPGYGEQSTSGGTGIDLLSSRLGGFASSRRTTRDEPSSSNRPKASAMDLDGELENIRNGHQPSLPMNPVSGLPPLLPGMPTLVSSRHGRDGGVHGNGDARISSGTGSGRVGKKSQAELDQELEDFFSAR